MQNIENYRTDDPCPDVPLQEIAALPTRVEALLARNRDKPLLKTGFVNVVGANEMLRGLCYHHDRFVKLYERLPAYMPDYAELDHEVVAYFNRLGQFYYFARSHFVKIAIADFRLLIPKMLSFIIFRNKFSSHRSLDAPQGETEDGKIAHARALSSSFGALSTPRPGATIPAQPIAGNDGKIPIEIFVSHLAEMHRNYYRSYQTFDEKSNTHVTFTLQIEHPAIAAEAYSVLEAVITHA